jgi:hypothetical protein
MKTPMQEHIEWLDIQWGNAKDCGEKTIDFEIAMKHAESLLEKEKEVMCEFAEEYVGSCLIDYPKIEVIFNQTFND